MMKKALLVLLFCLLAHEGFGQGFPVPGPGHSQYAGSVDTTPPAVPTGLSGTPSSTSVALTWSHSLPSDVDEYIVEYRCPSGSGGYTDAVPHPTTTAKTVSGLTSGVQCDFRVAAEDVFLNRSAFTTAIQVTPTAGSFAAFGPCTEGTNCLSDQLSADSAIYFIEDFDHDAYVEPSPTDPSLGYSNTNMVSGGADRGGSSRWVSKYFTGDGGGQWANGTPAAPTYGSTCTASSRCSGQRPWTIDDRWSLGPILSYMAILKDGWFSSFVPGSVNPTIPGSGGATVFGDAAFAFPTQPGAIGPVIGYRNWTVKPKLGYTAAWAYSSNILTASPSVLNQPWKHEEFDGAGGGSWGTSSGYQEALLGMNLNHPNQFPYNLVPGISILNCNARKAAATITKGQIYCPAEAVPGTTRVTMELWPQPADYTFNPAGGGTYSWDLSQWHCHMVYYDWTTITATRIRAWFDGHLLIDVTVDLSQERFDAPSGTDGVTGFYWNHYSNQNQYGPITNVIQAHYMDNISMRNGDPKQCSAIGFLSIPDVSF